MKEQYSDPGTIGRRLRHNLGSNVLAVEEISDPPNGFYDYAAHHWNSHLTALQSPSLELLDLAGTFLRSAQIAYWSEYRSTESLEFQIIRSTESGLRTWAFNLTSDQRERLNLGSYYVDPYQDLSRTNQGAGSDKSLPWLALMRVGFYYYDKGQNVESSQFRARVAAEFSKLLGPRNPLVLEAKSDVGSSYL